MAKRNILIDADSYKVNMYQQYPEGTQYVYSYVSARIPSEKPMVFIGLQDILNKLALPITEADVEEAAAHWATLDRSFNKEGWMRIVEKHGGKLPIKISAVKEGTVLATQNVLLVVVNTDPEFYWLTTWIETALQRLWYTCSVATRSYRIRQTIKEALELTGDVSLLDWKLHDMGSRAATCPEQAAIGTMAHLAVFNGTDTLTGRLLATEIYGAYDYIAGTIPAMEHSTVTSWGKDRELDAYENMYNKHLAGKPEAMCSIVMDSYNILNAIRGYADRIGDRIDSGGITVIRIDSGEPVDLLPRLMRVAEDNFSYYENEKGYAVFDKIRFIWSDGVTEESIAWILQWLEDGGWSADNFTFGVGGYLIQRVDRDTLSFAMKCSAVIIDGEMVGVSKNPSTAAFKKSRAGFLALRHTWQGYKTMEGTLEDGGLLEPVFLDGNILRYQTFDEIRGIIRQS